MKPLIVTLILLMLQACGARISKGDLLNAEKACAPSGGLKEVSRGWGDVKVTAICENTYEVEFSPETL